VRERGPDAGWLLDTHVWLWLMTGRSDRLDVPLRRSLERTRRERGLFISELSIWELGIKVARGRLGLQGSVADLAADTERFPGMRFVPFARAAMLEAVTLQHAPGDPFDRGIAATAIVLGLSLVTADRQLTTAVQGSALLRVVRV
jgi:PIN domain nuclease of toxin-antitoxin system